MIRKHMLIGQLLALVAAGVIVGTAIDVRLMWRNQSVDNVMSMASSHVVYKTNDVAIGEQTTTGKATKVTLLRFSPEGGWVIGGEGTWAQKPSVKRFAKVLVLPNETTGIAGAAWLCALRVDPHLTQIQLVTPGDPVANETLEFHLGGIIEPVSVADNTLIRGLIGQKVVFTWRPNPVN